MAYAHQDVPMKGRLMSKRIDKSWLVFSSVENLEHDRCVDLFSRPDATFGFEEFRRDVEDRGDWTQSNTTQVLFLRRGKLRLRRQCNPPVRCDLEGRERWGAVQRGQYGPPSHGTRKPYPQRRQIISFSLRSR